MQAGHSYDLHATITIFHIKTRVNHKKMIIVSDYIHLNAAFFIIILKFW